MCHHMIYLYAARVELFDKNTDRFRDEAFLHDRPPRFIPCNEKSLAARCIR